MHATAIPQEWGIPAGTPVYDAAGEKLGTVSGADPFNLTIARRRLFASDLVVPMSLVDRYEDGKLFLCTTKDRLPPAHPR